MEPWLLKLRDGDTDGAWDLFVERYRRLIFATIRHNAQGYDDVMDVFAWVCEGLRANDLERLRRYAKREPLRARFSTWLVAIVRNLIVDWFRHREGRKRLSTLVDALPPLERKIFEYLAHGLYTHVEVYELIRTREGIELSFAEFLRHLREIYRTVTEGRRGRLMRELIGPPAGDPDLAVEEDVAASDTAQRLAEALDSLPADVRVALELFVIEELPATEVARIVGWPSAKTVYNRVYRALAAIRAWLERRGIGPADL